jgi:hypothetical protein
MKHAIMRNFGGLKSDEVDPFQEFCTKLNMAEEEPDPDEYMDDQEVAISNQLSLCFICICTRILSYYALCLNRYGQSLIRTAQG